MRILFVSPMPDFSVADVARGYLAALRRQGHEVREYAMSRRVTYHAKALGEVRSKDITLLSLIASENIVSQALLHKAEMVIICAALGVHPDAIWMLRQVQIPASVIFTESPYDDVKQVEFHQVYPEMLCATHDAYSARQHGWLYLPCAFDPAYHYPTPPSIQERYDVLFVGTGWGERQRFLEAVDWSGINLKLLGMWPEIKADSPLAPFHEEQLVNNEAISGLYAAATICLNFHRAGAHAESPNPRTFELAACGAFQLSDYRAEIPRLFGENIPVFETPDQLSGMLRFYLADAGARKRHAIEARKRVSLHTFDTRARTLIAALEQQKRDNQVTQMVTS